MAASLDYCMGVLITAVVAHFAGQPLALWQYALGGMLGFLPDIDILFLWLLGRTDLIPKHHTFFTHWPLLVIPTATGIATYFFGEFWGTVTFLSVLWHFMHDSKGPLGGAGIMWFQPFSKKEWSLSGREESTQDQNPQLDDWLMNQWLRPSTLSLREIGLGALALGGGSAIAYGLCTGFMFATLALASTFVVWWLHADT